MAQQDTDFYKRLRLKIEHWLDTKEGKTHKYAEYIMAIPDLFHLITRLMLEKDVSVGDKAKLGLAIVYFISPLDFIPEAIVGPIGYLDDLALLAFVLNGIINNGNEDIVKKLWAGDGDVLELVKNIIRNADELIGSGLWNKIKGLFNSSKDDNSKAPN